MQHTTESIQNLRDLKQVYELLLKPYPYMKRYCQRSFCQHCAFKIKPDDCFIKHYEDKMKLIRKKIDKGETL